jgi:UPF0716 family protein affecting phage T7 exclusion
MKLNPLLAFNVIGITAIGMACVISVFTGDLVVALIGLLILTFLTGAALLSTDKSGWRGIPRLVAMQRGGRAVGTVACWALVFIGGAWQFVPAGIILTATLLSAPIMAMIRRSRHSTRNAQQHELHTSQPQLQVKPPPPPLYTPTIVQINPEKEQHSSIIQTPLPIAINQQ